MVAVIQARHNCTREFQEIIFLSFIPEATDSTHESLPVGSQFNNSFNVRPKETGGLKGSHWVLNSCYLNLHILWTA
jgi:hypothetical protein